MEQVIELHIEKLPEGVYLAESDVVQGLVAQGRTIQETLEIARDVAKRLLEAEAEHRRQLDARDNTTKAPGGKSSNERLAPFAQNDRST
jgi:predicted RNase H-like HicB family nuclease